MEIDKYSKRKYNIFKHVKPTKTNRGTPIFTHFSNGDFIVLVQAQGYKNNKCQ